MARTTAALVKGVLTSHNYYSDADMTPYIRWAYRVVERSVRCATSRGETYLEDDLVEMETLLAAWHYLNFDPMYKRKKTEKAEGEFLLNDLLMAVKMLDSIGCVTAVLQANSARGIWLGKPYRDQRSYDTRNL